jgi:predicted ribosomally synthesized peptide with SipW-like signal peptide
VAQEDKRRKVLAVLAGGLVLGVGAAVTLAAWNDSEFATGTFSAGEFNLEGATDAATGDYADHAAADDAAALAFTLPLADNLSPDDTVFAPFWVRLDETTTSPATLVADGVTATDVDGTNSAQLSYTVHAIPAASPCDATTAATGTVVASGTTLAAQTLGTPVPLAAGTTDAAGAPVQLCFAVTASADLQQGGETTATWAFEAVSG